MLRRSSEGIESPCTLRFRRLRGVMINVFKILNCDDRSLCPSLKLSVEYTGRSGRNSWSLFQGRSHLYGRFVNWLCNTTVKVKIGKNINTVT